MQACGWSFPASTPEAATKAASATTAARIAAKTETLSRPAFWTSIQNLDPLSGRTKVSVHLILAACAAPQTAPSPNLRPHPARTRLAACVSTRPGPRPRCKTPRRTQSGRSPSPTPQPFRQGCGGERRARLAVGEGETEGIGGGGACVRPPPPTSADGGLAGSARVLSGPSLQNHAAGLHRRHRAPRRPRHLSHAGLHPVRQPGCAARGRHPHERRSHRNRAEQRHWLHCVRMLRQPALQPRARCVSAAVPLRMLCRCPHPRSLLAQGSACPPTSPMAWWISPRRRKPAGRWPAA